MHTDETSSAVILQTVLNMTFLYRNTRGDFLHWDFRMLGKNKIKRE